MGRPVRARGAGRSRFVVERYTPGTTVAGARIGARRLRRAAPGLGSADQPVRYLGSIVIASEDTVLSIFEAERLEDVARLLAVARVDADRIVPVVELRESERPAPARELIERSSR